MRSRICSLVGTPPERCAADSMARATSTVASYAKNAALSGTSPDQRLLNRSMKEAASDETDAETPSIPLSVVGGTLRMKRSFLSDGAKYQFRLCSLAAQTSTSEAAWPG